MKIRIFLFIFSFLYFTTSIAGELTPAIKLNKIAQATGVNKKDLIVLELTGEELKITYFSKYLANARTVQKDLGVNRVIEYMISEIKGQDSRQIKTPNPITQNGVMLSYYFISSHLFNLFNYELEAKLYNENSVVHFYNSSFSSRLKSFVQRPYSNFLSDTNLFITIKNLIGLSDEEIKAKGFCEPSFDMAHMILAYTILNHFGIYTGLIHQVSLDEEMISSSQK